MYEVYDVALIWNVGRADVLSFRSKPDFLQRQKRVRVNTFPYIEKKGGGRDLVKDPEKNWKIIANQS